MTKTTNIIDNVKFTYEVSDNQKGTFTPNHIRYRCVIKYNNRQYTFEYQCNPNNTEPNIKDCLWCLMMDMYSAEGALDVDDFLRELGYDSDLAAIRKGEAIYKACLKTAKALKRIFSEEELDALQEYYEDY